MIDSDIIDALSSEQLANVKNALLTIMSSGVIESQQERLLARLAAGTTTESDDDLARRVRAYRLDNLVLESFKELGRKYQESE